MGCSVLDLVLVASVCRQPWGCRLENTNGGGLQLASARNTWVEMDGSRALYVHPSATAGDFLVDGESASYQKTASPLLGLPLAEIPLPGSQKEVVISTRHESTRSIHVAVCEESNSAGVDFFLLPYSRAAASGWRGGYWLFALPIFVVPLFYDKEKGAQSVVYAVALTDLLLWAVKIAACMYYSALSLQNGITMGSLGLLAAFVAAVSCRSNSTATAVVVALLSFATSFTYYTPLAVLSTCLFIY